MPRHSLVDREYFTPLTPSGQRMRIPLSEVQVLRGTLSVRGYGRKATVVINGGTYDVWSTSCGSHGCYCDATLREPGSSPAS